MCMIYIYIYIHTFVCVYTFLQAHNRILMCQHANQAFVHDTTQIGKYTCTYTHACTEIHMHVHTCLHAGAHTNLCKRLRHVHKGSDGLGGGHQQHNLGSLFIANAPQRFVPLRPYTHIFIHAINVCGLCSISLTLLQRRFSIQYTSYGHFAQDA
jgi:hypothetical protein